jgi:hypothetical protein
LTLKLIASSAVKSWIEMDGAVNRAGGWKVFKSITFSGGATLGMTHQKIFSLFAQGATKRLISEARDLLIDPEYYCNLRAHT